MASLLHLLCTRVEDKNQKVFLNLNNRSGILSTGTRRQSFLQLSVTNQLMFNQLAVMQLNFIDAAAETGSPAGEQIG